MLFELTTLTGSVFTANKVKGLARNWLDRAVGCSVLGMWTSNIGRIGDLIILRAFETEESLAVERERALLDADPFGSTSVGARLTMESYAPFPFLPDPAPRDYGGVFEFRTYHLVPGGLRPTMSAWQSAIGPAQRYTSHLVIGLYALDGDPRITHIWGFPDIGMRNDLRQEHYAAGLWPPKGGPEQIDHATSTIALSEPGFPIR